MLKKHVGDGDARVSKSTFAAPSAPTSGLAGYELEGARKDFAIRRKPRSGFFSQPTITPGAGLKAPAASKESTMDKLALFVPLTKIDVEKRLVFGRVAFEKKDKANEIFDYDTSKPYFEAWSSEISKATDGKSLGNLRAMHNKVAAGKLTDLVFDDAEKTIEACSKVVDDAEWNKCLEGVYSGFSMGGGYVKRWADPKDPTAKRYTANPTEISLVDNPCIPGATFEIVKGDGSTELRKFAEPPAPPVITNEQVAAKATELAKAAGTDKKWTDFIDRARTELEATTGQAETIEKAAAPAPAESAAAGASDPDEIGKQVWVNDRLPGKSFLKKADLRQALVEMDAEQAAAKIAAPLKEALKSVTDELDKKDGGVKKPVADSSTKAAGKTKDDLAKRDFSEDDRKKLAGEGKAMKDGSFPIEDKGDLENAVKAYGRAKNKAVAKRHIIKRAKALGATDLLPDDWTGGTKDKKSEKIVKIDTSELKKAATIYNVSNLLGLLGSLEAAEEGLETDLNAPNGYCYPCYDSGGTKIEVPKELTDRFGSLLVEFGDCIAELLDLILGSMRDEEAEEAMKIAAPVLGLLKINAASKLAKIGARHSRSDQKNLNTVHDLLVELGAECDAEAGDDDAAKAMHGEELNKMTAQRDALEKSMSDIAGTLKDMAERVKRIEAQPAPRPNYRTVEKNQDSSLGGGDAFNADELLKNPQVLNKLADQALRLAHERPMTVLPKSS